MGEIQEIKEDVRTLPQSIFNIVGVSTSVFLAFLFSDWLGIIPGTIWEGAFLLLGLPFLFIFVLGIVTNNPNFGVKTQWGLGIYLLISFVLFLFYFGDPSSITSYVKLIGQYAIAVLIVFVSAIFYVIPERFLVRKGVEYRWRAIASFGLSFIATIGFIYLLRYIKVVSLVTIT